MAAAQMSQSIRVGSSEHRLTMTMCIPCLVHVCAHVRIPTHVDGVLVWALARGDRRRGGGSAGGGG